MNWGHTGLLEKQPEGADIRDAVVADAAMQLRERHTAKYAAASSVDSDTSLVLCHHLRFELAALAYFLHIYAFFALHLAQPSSPRASPSLRSRGQNAK